MNSTDKFDLDLFASLHGSDLVSYAEPFVNTQTQAVPESAYPVLVSNLAVLDSEHLVYALELCMGLKPHEFAPVVVGYLAHHDASVSCTAFRILQKTPASLISADMKRKLAATPVVDLVTRDVRTGDEIRIGTNTEFVRELLNTFAR